MFNDLKAPRFNPRKYRENLASIELYEKWKETSGLKKTFNDFKRICELIGEEMIDSTVSERDGIRLGNGMGDVYVGYVPNMKRQPIDYKLSREYNKLIKHENWLTNNKVGKIIYGTSKRKYIFKNPRLWSFQACRNFKIAVIKALKETPEQFKNSIEKRSGK